ncbi:MAG TPA: S-layer homology domain-containing protein [Candidatus Obscuribacterales bacterium]
MSACANTSTSKALEKTFAADPILKNNPVIFGSSSQKTPDNSTLANLPADFPSEIPLYPEAQLKEIKLPTTPDNQDQQTVWTTTDPSNLVQNFYSKAFDSNNWQIVSQPTDDAGGTFVARRNNLQVTLSINPSTVPGVETASPNQPFTSSTPKSATEFVIEYSGNTDTAAVPQAGDSEFVGPVLPSEVASSPNATKDATAPTQTPVKFKDSVVFNDLNKAPTQLRQYIENLAELGILTPDQAKSKTNAAASTLFEPNKTISRRQYVRWLVAANNQLYANNPGKQIRLASTDAQPAFQDVPRTDADFPAIQGLAEAGLIPSSLSGDATAVLFRPNTPLTRENLILWKVPLDTRQVLPSASIDAVKQTWGFQDAAKIDPKALRAVLADFQNGDQANIRRAFAYTALFQPKKPVTRAEAAAALWYFGYQGEGLSAKEALQQSQPSATSEPTPSSSASP